MRLVSRALFACLLVAAVAPLGSCSKDKVVAAPCQDDSSCQNGYLCENYRCVEASTKACTVVIDGNPILQPDPYSVMFGDLDTNTAEQKVTLHNIGNCTLTLFEMSLAGGDKSNFGCDMCSTSFPQEIFPGRQKELTISFKTDKTGSYSDELKILSDDKEFPELRVPIHANFIGIPDVRVNPNPMDFGYVPQGLMKKKSVQISNQGSGTATVDIQSISLNPPPPASDPSAGDFEIVDAPTTFPITLAPIANDESQIINFEVDYHPRSSAVQTATLVVMTSKGEVDVPLTGNSQTPPKITVNPTTVDMGKVPLGHTNIVPITLVNSGGAPLNVSPQWQAQNTSTDLFFTPSTIPPIAPGAYTTLNLEFTATAIETLDEILVLSTNDPSTPSVSIAVHAEGVAGPGPEVVKIDMTFDNGADGTFDKDLRNVDLSLEHPYGYLCNKQNPAPTTWGTYGNPTWIAIGPKEEPERIVLADATADGTYRIMVSYAEDCSSIPSELMAGILGISVDALVGYLSSGAIQINGQDVSSLISKVCLSHDSSNVTVRVYVNGAEIKEKSITLAKKGDSQYVLDLIHSSGVFTAQ